MATQSSTTIANRALQMVGAASIMALTDDSREARACQTCYDTCRRAELQAHKWRFSIKRATLAASADAPLFGFAYAFPLPADCLDIILPNDPCLDWQVEGRSILTNQGMSADLSGTGPELALRYKADITDPTTFNALFCEALSAAMAMEIVEPLTQSNTKAQMIQQKYKYALDRASAANAIEVLPQEAPEDPWIVAHGG
jgi:hypothetical protein